MNFKLLKYFLLTIVLISLFGCGKKDPSTISFFTVQVDVGAVDYVVDADVIKQEDTDDNGIPDTDVGVEPTNAKVQIVVNSLNLIAIEDEASHVKSSPILVEKVDVSYSPTDSSFSAISDFTEMLGVVIDAGSSSTVEIRVGSHEIKEGLYFLKNTGEIYKYNVTLKFKVIEINSGKEGTVETTITVRFANFADSS